jgi:hypothetical protein
MKLKNTVPITASEMIAANERAVLKLKLPDSTKYPRPLDAASHSATIAPSTAKVVAIRKPAKIYGMA